MSYGEFLKTRNNFYSFDALGRSISKNKMNEYVLKFTKINTMVPEQNQSIILLKEGKTYDGYVTGTVHIIWCEVDKDTNGDYEVRSIEIRMYVNSGPIHTECNDVRLIAHEKKHKEIWDDKINNVNEIITVTIPKNFSSKDICRLEAEKAWPYVRDVLYNIYSAHNKWDDEDVNNVSHERIDVYSKMQENQEVFFRRCK